MNSLNKIKKPYKKAPNKKSRNVLKVKFPQRCIGCEMCIIEVQKQFKKVGLDGALIRILKNNEVDQQTGFITFNIYLDPAINTLDIKKIAASCPTGVFSIEEELKDEYLS